MSVPVRRPTYEDYLAAVKRGEAVEWVDGDLVHKAQPVFSHGSAQMALGGLLWPFRKHGGPPGGSGEWWFATEADVGYSQRAEVFRHDVAGWRKDRCPRPPSGFPVEPTPDWVCEVLSPSTAGVDVVKKQRTLHAHHVVHYWLVDPVARTLVVMRHSEGGYLQVLTATVGMRVRAEPFEAVELDVDELFTLEA